MKHISSQRMAVAFGGLVICCIAAVAFNQMADVLAGVIWFFAILKGKRNTH